MIWLGEIDQIPWVGELWGLHVLNITFTGVFNDGCPLGFIARTLKSMTMTVKTKHKLGEFGVVCIFVSFCVNKDV